MEGICGICGVKNRIYYVLLLDLQTNANWNGRIDLLNLWHCKRGRQTFLSCFSEKPCLNSPWRGIFVFWRKFSSTIALISEILLVLLKVITIVVNLQKKKKLIVKRKIQSSLIPWVYNGHGKDYQLRGARAFPNWTLSYLPEVRKER